MFLKKLRINSGHKYKAVFIAERRVCHPTENINAFSLFCKILHQGFSIRGPQGSAMEHLEKNDVKIKKCIIKQKI